MKRKSALSHDETLMRLARNVAKLETKSRELRRQLKTVSTELRFRRRELKQYAAQFVDGVPWNERAPRFGTLGDK